MKTRFVLVALFAQVISTFSPTYANSQECPSNWSEKVPQLVVQPFSITEAGFTYQVWDNNLAGRNFEKNAPELNLKIKNLGANVISKPSFEFSRFSDFNKIKRREGISLSPFEFSYRQGQVGNGDFIRFALQLEVKGCPVQTLYSNIVQLTGFTEQVTDLKDYLPTIKNYDDKGRPLNFKEAELIEPLLKQLVQKLLQSPKVGMSIPLERITRDDLVFYYSWGIWPLTNDECLSSNPNFKSAVFNSLPCKFAIFGSHTLPIKNRLGPLTYTTSPASGMLYDQATFPVLVGVYEAKSTTESVAASKASPTLTPKSNSVSQRAQVFINCKELNKVYPGGIALPGAINAGSKTKLTPTFDKRLYEANKKSDRDKDGIACEK